jgi:hypothetical protein
MRSRRSRFELSCRVGAFGLLGWLLGTTVFPSSGRRTQRATGAQVESQLESWTRASPTVTLHGDFAVVPEPWIIAWLAALRHSGHLVTWSGSPEPVAMSAEALPDPRGGARIDIAAPAGSTVVVRDAAGIIGSVRVARLGASVIGPTIDGSLSGTSSAQSFAVAAPSPIHARAVLIIGAAGWEGKFIASALEERGWPVSVRFSVAPHVDIAQGNAQLLDTSRVAAVIAVDTSVAAFHDAIVRFVQSGGGLVLAGAAGFAPSVAVLAPVSLEPRVRATVAPADTIGLGSTGMYPGTSLRADGVVLERRAGRIAMAARRFGAGRVIELGYDDTWRWRMDGGAGSENAHREWWSRVVESVAYAPEDRAEEAANPNASSPDNAGAGSAPLARLVDRLGPSRAASLTATDSGRPIDQRILAALIMLLLLSEWASRRMRGIR